MIGDFIYGRATNKVRSVVQEYALKATETCAPIKYRFTLIRLRSVEQSQTKW